MRLGAPAPTGNVLRTDRNAAQGCSPTSALFSKPRREGREAPWLAVPSVAMLETTKLSNADPRTYLKPAAIRAIEDRGTVTLPQDIA